MLTSLTLNTAARRCLRPFIRPQQPAAFSGGLVYFPPRGSAIAAWLIDYDATDDMCRIAYDFVDDSGRTLTARCWVAADDVLPRDEWDELVYAE